MSQPIVNEKANTLSVSFLDAHIVGPYGEAIIIIDGQKIPTLGTYFRHCKDAGIDPREYLKAIRQNVDFATFRDIKKKYG